MLLAREFVRVAGLPAAARFIRPLTLASLPLLVLLLAIVAGTIRRAVMTTAAA